MMRELMLTPVAGQPLHQRLAERVGVGGVVTPLRVFDVAVWYAYNPRPKVQQWVQKIQDDLVAEKRIPQLWAPRERS